MILPRGITGYGVPKGHPYADAQAFDADCWQVVGPRHGRVEDRQQLLSPRTTIFLTRVLLLPRGEITVLLNKVHPWVGFCRPFQPGDCTLEFAVPPFETFRRYRVLSRAELEEPVNEAMLTELRTVERKQIKHWGKMVDRLRVGDVVFNFWD